MTFTRRPLRSPIWHKVDVFPPTLLARADEVIK
jgi:hypothetical protein